MDNDILQVALQLRKKANIMSEVFELTKQLQDTMNRNDEKTIKMVLKMRTDVMLSSEPIELELQRLIKALPEEKRLDVEKQLSRDFKHKKPPGTYRLNDIYLAMISTIEKTIEINDRLTLKFNMALSKNKKKVAE